MLYFVLQYGSEVTFELSIQNSSLISKYLYAWYPSDSLVVWRLLSYCKVNHWANFIQISKCVNLKWKNEKIKISKMWYLWRDVTKNAESDTYWNYLDSYAKMNCCPHDLNDPLGLQCLLFYTFDKRKFIVTSLLNLESPDIICLPYSQCEYKI